MLSRARRMNRATFDITRKSRFVVNNPVASLRFLPSREDRFSVVVSKSLAKKATQRNLLRRRAYALLQENNLPLQGIFYLKKADASLSELASGLKTLLTAAYKTVSSMGLKSGPK